MLTICDSLPVQTSTRWYDEGEEVVVQSSTARSGRSDNGLYHKLLTEPGTAQ